MEEYKLAASLIIDVITSKVTAKEALSRFPKNNDINLKCAFDAIMHYEADEDLRAKTRDYAKMQDEYLEYIAHLLSQGNELPQDVIQRYVKFHKDNLMPSKEKGFRSFIKYVKRMINF